MPLKELCHASDNHTKLSPFDAAGSAVLCWFIDMPLLEIKIYPDPVLKEVAQPVEKFDERLGKFLDDMRETMLRASGVGLAANQVGILERVVVADISEERNEPMELINPEIIHASGTLVSSDEGCLSIPDFRETIKRPRDVVVRAQDRKGELFEIEADGFLAMCLQHEIDHLNGILFVDHLSRLKREFFKRWLKRNS